MKTTYVINYCDLNKVKNVPTFKKNKIIDYYFHRNKMIRWDVENDRFTEINGLIDVSFTRQILLTPEEAKSKINIKNVDYLINRKVVGEFFFDIVNLTGEIQYVVCENVKKKEKVFNDYHIIFDELIVDHTPPFAFKNVFYGNIYDYIRTYEAQKTE